MPRIDSDKIIDIFYSIATDRTATNDYLARTALMIARGLSTAAPTGDHHSKFHDAARDYVLAQAAEDAYNRASSLLREARLLPAYNRLESARSAITGMDGARNDAEDKLVAAWERLFADVPSAHSGSQLLSDCCPLTGQEYGTEA